MADVEEPTLNVDLGNLFVNEGQELPNDFMDTSSDDTARDKKIVDDSRVDWAQEIDRDNDNGKDNNPDHNPAQSADFEYKGAMKQADGFRRRAARQDVVARVSANRQAKTLVGSTVHLAQGKLKTVGRVIAVGEKEFCVVWQDKKASIEKKADYHLVPLVRKAQAGRRPRLRRPVRK
jgi:hypothetical protein